MAQVNIIILTLITKDALIRQDTDETEPHLFVNIMKIKQKFSPLSYIRCVIRFSATQQALTSCYLTLKPRTQLGRADFGVGKSEHCCRIHTCVKRYPH